MYMHIYMCIFFVRGLVVLGGNTYIVKNINALVYVLMRG